MFIDHILLENYRNYTSLDIELSNDVNVFYGNNGQGKTNLLESVFYTVIGKSFRGTKDVDIINYGKEYFSIDIDVCDDITEKISIKYNKNKEKYIKVNSLYLRKTGQLMGNIIAVIFSPEDMQLISEGPSVRRKFLDIAISQIKPTYYFDLLQYNKILFQKNTLLKNIKYGKFKEDNAFLTVWNEQLSDIGAKIIYERNKMINELSLIAADKHLKIAEKSAEKEEIFKISYSTDISREILETKDILKYKEELFKLLENKSKKEIEREMTLSGPHRDDIDFKLDEKDMKKFSSQGQKRTAILSLKLAELELLKKVTGRKPIFLLDDVFSELDDKRQQAFLGEIKGVQTFISCVNIDSLKCEEKKLLLFEIKNGGVVEKSFL